MDDTWWMADAACKDIPDADSIFFAHSSGKRGRAAARYVRARKICATCPVREYCLMYAIAHKIAYGVWGGMSDRERRRIDRDTKLRVRRVWKAKQLQIRLRGGEKLGQRNRSVRSVPRSSSAAGGARHESGGHSA